MLRSSCTVAQCCCHSPGTGQADSKPSLGTASGHQRPVYGTKVPEVEMDNEDLMKMTFAVMNVTSTLTAVSRVVKTGQKVVFPPEESIVRASAAAHR